MGTRGNSNKKSLIFDIANSCSKINKTMLSNEDQIEKHIAWQRTTAIFLSKFLPKSQVASYVPCFQHILRE